MPADNLGDTTVGVAYSHTITATGGSGALSYAASGLPAGLSMSGSGAISGTATAAGDFSVAVTVTDTAAQTASQTYPLKVYAAPALAPASLPDGSVGAAYSATASATGGKAPVVLSQSGGTLPSGLSFNAGTGVIAGTPDTAGASTFTLQARDANGATASQSYTVSIAPALSLAATIPATGNVGTAYSGFVAATGGKSPITYSVASGLLPPGLSLSPSAGTITGTPTFAGTYAVTLAATDANGTVATRTASIDIFSNGPPTVVTTSLPNGVVGAAYSASLVAQLGRPPYAWSLATGSSLPAGLSLSANGQISGSPTAAGPTDFRVVATDANGQTATADLRISVFAALTVLTSSLPEGYATLAYSPTTLAAAGGQAPYGWSVSGGLPPGLTFTASSATLSGTPAAGSAGSYGVTFTVSDASGQTQSASFTITLYALPQVTTATLADGSVGASYSQLLQASGGKAPLTWSITTGSLPAGVLLDSSGAILGTPTAAGTSTFVVQVSDTNGRTATRVLSIAIFSGLVVTYGSAPDGYTGAAYNQTLTAAGGRTPYTWSIVAGALPAGLTLSGASGTLSGSPTGPGTSTFTAQVTDANSVTATKSISITVYDPPRIVTTTLPDGYVGQVYPSVTLQGAAGKAPYTYAVTGGSLPAGLSLSSGGVLSGTPTAASAASIVVTITDQNGRTATQSYTFGTFAMPAISTTALADGYTGVAYSASVVGAGGKTPYTFSLTAGSLPAGLSLAAGGAISGTPSGAPGTSTFTVTMTDANGISATASLSIAVLSALVVTTPSLADGYTGSAYSQSMAASGGKTPYRWSSGALPAGLALNTNTGAITGTPSAAGTTTVVFTVSDANNASASRSLTIAVYAPPAVTAAALPDAYPSVSYLAAVTGTGGKAPYSFSAGPGLPSGLIMSAGGAISGNTTASPGTGTFTVTLTDANGVTASGSFSISVRADLVVTTTSLPDAYLTTGYSQALAAGGGRTPYTWSIGSGALPAGVTLDSVAGVLSGTPTAAGASSFTVRVTDANGVTAGRALTIQTYALPSITTTALADAVVNAAYSQPLSMTGGKAPFTWLQTGTLPPGITFNTSTGAFTGTATATGAFPGITAQVTDANGRSSLQVTYTLSVVNTITITTASINDAYQAISFNQAVTAAGGLGAPYTFTITAGALPAGLTLLPTGVISGTPTASPGSYSFTIRAQDSGSNTGSRTFTQVVWAPPAVATTTLPDGYTDQAYSATLAGTGGRTPYTWSITAGAPPAGLSLAGGTGVFSGTPTAAGTSTFIIQLSDANGVTASRSLTIAAFAPPVQTSPATLADAYLGTAYNVPLGVTGGRSPFTWTASAGLPPGIALSLSGVLSGTPTATGTFTFTTTVTDANGRTATASHTITVFAPLIITTASPLPDGYRSVAYSVTLAASGGAPPLTWSLTSGSLPAGLTLGSGGAITGTPSASGTFTVTITVTDRNGTSASKSFTLVVHLPLAVATTAVADGYVGRSYGDTLTATGGRPPYTWALTSGALPPGLTLSSTGAITGVPSTTGTFSFVVTVTDQDGITATRAFTQIVYASPAITTTSFPDAYVGQAYAATAAGAGGKAPYTWSITAGALPAGLVLTGSSGAIGGTATGTTQSFTLTLTDANGVTASQIFTISVYTQPAITSTSPLADGYATQPYAFAFGASGGKAPLTWQLTAGALPPGLTLSTAGVLGTAIGAAGQNQVFGFTVSVTDANGRNATALFQLTTYQLPAITTAALTTATEGVTYLRAPATPEQLAATGGKTPYTFSSGAGLPAGISLAAGTGVLSGIPAQGTAGPHAVTFTVADANGRSGSASLNLQVRAAAPVFGGGTVGVAPAGSPITDTLTVFTTDYEGRTYPGLGVRIRKNGVELAPVKEQLTDANGKTVFTGLGLNGTTDTVDVTVNGPNVANESFLKVNAAIVSVAMMDYPVPLPRAYANGAMDPVTGRLIVTGGLNSTWYGSPVVNSLLSSTQNDLLRLTNPVTGAWSEDLPPGMTNAPPLRFWAGMAYASGSHVLFGGGDNTFAGLNDTWLYSTATGAWTRSGLSGAIPSPRDQVAMAAVGNTVYLFGGEDGPFSASALDDLYSFSPSTGTWSSVPPFGPTPSPRFNAGAAGTINELWVCGGNDGLTDLADCWSYNPASLFWSPRGGMPSPRQGLAMTATSGGTIYAFGGTSSGIPTNELLASFGGGPLSPVPATNPPPAREGAVLAYESSANRLILFGGAANDFVYNDVWTFDLATSTWTQRTQTWSKPAAGLTLTGTITNGNTGTRSRLTIEASGTSGYVSRQIFNLTGGNGSYTMTGIPAGDTLSLTALNEDLNQGVYPNREWSWLDLGVIATNVSGNLTQNVNLPSGPMTSQLLTTTSSYVLPSGWQGTTFAALLARLTRPGFANHPNGTNQVNLAARTFRADYFPPGSGTSQTLIPEVESDTGSACELSIMWLYNVAAGPLPAVTFPPGPRSMSPGISGCAPTGTGLQLSTQVQGNSSSTAPAVAVGDMNGDGIADVTLLNADQVLIFNGLSSGEGSFLGASTTLTLAGFSPTSMGIADFDRNGRPDVVVGIGTTNQIALFLQTSPGTFTGPAFSGAGTQVQGLATGDFNGDGNPDVAVVGQSPAQVSQVNGRGDGTFNPFSTVATGAPSYTAIASAEFNGDAFTDVVYGVSGQISFLRGTATTLQIAATYPVPSTPTSLAAGDLDGDGLLDVAVATQFPNTLQVELNRNGFTFINGPNVPLTGSGPKVAIAELTGDTLMDVAVTMQTNTVTVLRGTGGGGLTSFFTSPTQFQPTSLAVGDFNADGNADVVVGEVIAPIPAQVELFAALRPIPSGTDNYSFVAPASTQMFFLDRGPSQIAWDSEIYSRGQAGTNTTTFPALSTLRPGRPTPAGQTVMWSPVMMIASPANLSMDSFFNFRVKLDAETQPPVPSQYRR